jgi:dGTPase
MNLSIRRFLEEQEKRVLSPFATFSADSRGRARPEPACEIRPAFMRDRDRIIHSKAFRRLKHKTQVFLAPKGDHYRTRMTHTLEVSQISRTLAVAMKLNENLTEAIALAHDLGHTPFGHAGERRLNELLSGGFAHVQQSARVVEALERDGRGLNLTREVVEGILFHSKGKGPIVYRGELGEEITPEAQIVRIADIIAYVNHDLDDALRAEIFSFDRIPRRIIDALGKTHGERIDAMVRDVIASTALDQERRVVLSLKMEAALVELRDFLYDELYNFPLLLAEYEKGEKIINDLFQFFMAEQEEFRQKYLGSLPYRDGHERAVADFIAGMTDRYAMTLHGELFGGG